MCSFLFTNKEIEDLDYVNRYMEDRGPDSTNVVEVGDYTFVHNLLSISGEFTPQPFLNEERQIACVYNGCLLYTSPSPRDATLSRMPSSA